MDTFTACNVYTGYAIFFSSRLRDASCLQYLRTCTPAVGELPHAWLSQKLTLSDEDYQRPVSQTTSENLWCTAGSAPYPGEAGISAKWVSQDLL